MNKRWISAILFLSFVLGLSPVTAQQTDMSENEVNLLENEFIIKFTSNYQSSLNEIVLNAPLNSDIALQNQLSGVSQIETIETTLTSSGNALSLVHIESNDYKKTLQELNELDFVEFAEPNYILQAYEAPEQWWFDSQNGINAERVWNITQGSEEVLVAVIDSGIDIYHEALTSSIYTNPNESDDGLDNDNNGYIDDIHGWDFSEYEDVINNGDNSVYDDVDDDSHGTHIAGIIAGNSEELGVGIAPNIKILPLKFLHNNRGSTFNAIKAIEYAQAMDADIVNCSWGSEAYSVLLEETMRNSDMLFVCAAGNEGMNMIHYPQYPADYQLSNLISVAATDNNGYLANFSNYGVNVTVAAPGENIYSTLPEDNYGWMSGTSMAAPMVTGVAALIKSNNNNLDAKQIKSVIVASTEEKGILKEKIQSNGMIDAYNAVTILPDLPDLPYGVYKSEVITVNNDIYVCGGFSGNEYKNEILKLDPVDEDWENAAYMPEAKAGFKTVAHDNKIYFFGGSDGEIKNNVDIYNLLDNTWSVGAPLPEALYGFSAVEKDGSVYIFGGIGNNGYKNSVYRYDMTNNSWTQLGQMPEAIAFSEAVVFDDNIYLFGGASSEECKNSIYMYDETSDMWTETAQMAVPRKDFAAVEFQNKIYLISGSASYNPSGGDIIESISQDRVFGEALIESVEVFDPLKKESLKIDRLPEAVLGLDAFKYNNEIYTVGGWNSETEINVNKYFGLSFPKNIYPITDDGNFEIIWNQVFGADGYDVEIDGVVYECDSNYFLLENDTAEEHIIKIRTIKDDTASLWSDEIHYKVNVSLRDAKEIGVDSVNENNFSREGEVHWYKIEPNIMGTLKISLSNIPEGCVYDIQLCNFAGIPVMYGREENNEKIIDNIMLSKYHYYIKVIASYGSDPDNDYTLICEFEPAQDEDIPLRAFCSELTLDPYNEKSGFDDGIIEIDNIEQMKITPKERSVRRTEDEEIFVVNPEEQAVYENFSIEPYAANKYYTDGYTDSRNFKNGDEQYYVYKTQSVGDTGCRIIVIAQSTNTNKRMSLTWKNVYPEMETVIYYDDKKGYTILEAWLDECNSYYDMIVLAKNTNGAPISCDLSFYVEYISPEDKEKNDDCQNIGNNANSGAVNIGSMGNGGHSKSLIGKIDHPYDKDVYQIKLGRKEKLEAMLISPEGEQHSVYINGGQSAGLGSGVSVEGTNLSYASVYSDGISQCYISVSTEDKSYSRDETYTLYVYCYSMSDLGDDEVNDNFDYADKRGVPAEIGTEEKIADPIEFTIDSPIDIDYYAVDMNEGEKLSIQMEMPAEYVDSEYKYAIEIHEPTLRTEEEEKYNYISYYNHDSPYLKYTTFVAPETKRYYVAVRSIPLSSFEAVNMNVGEETYDMKCTLTITKASADAMDMYETGSYTDICHTTNDFTRFTWTEDNRTNTFITAAELTNGSVSGNLDTQLDIDWYRYTAAGDEFNRVELLSDNNTFLLNSTLIILDKSGEAVASGSGGLFYELPENQDCYIGVCIDKPEQYSAALGNTDYTLAVKSGTSNISDLHLTKKTGGSYIYVNHPEHITNADIIQEKTQSHENNSLIYHNDNVSGVNTMYVTHSVLENSNMPPQNFYYDIDFYNPSSEDIVISLTMPYYAVEVGYHNYGSLKNLYEEKLLGGHMTIDVEIPHDQHKLLFKDILGELLAVDVTQSAAYIAIFADFTVPAGKSISVSTLAAYDPQYLDLVTWQGNIYSNAGANEVIVNKSTFIKERDSEKEINRKIKGTDPEGTNEIIGILNYIIDDYTPNGPLEVNLLDEFYDDEIANPKTSWMTNVNPFGGNQYGRTMAMPSNLHAFRYKDTTEDNGELISGEWMFDFLHVNPQGTGNPAYAYEERLPGELNYHISDEMIDYFKDIARTGVDNPEMPNGIEYANWEEIVMMLGSWGVTYNFRINIDNVGDETRYLNYVLQMGEFVGVEYSIWNRTDNITESHSVTLEADKNQVGDGYVRGDKTVFSIPLEPGKSYSVRISLLNGVGTVSFEHKLSLSDTQQEIDEA